MTLPTMLSVDFDFFVWRADRTPERKLRAWPGTPREQDVHALQLFDWGHSEAHSPLMQQILWLGRASAFHRAGLDPEATVTVRSPSVTEFLATLHKRTGWDGDAWLSDSHGYGYAVARGIAEGEWSKNEVHLLHFDAHHDLGYSKQDRRDVTCASWAYHALKAKLVRSMTIVYPDWQAPDIEPWDTHHQRLGNRVRKLSWSQWVSEQLRYEIVGAHLVRSSAWTPPWLDQQFLGLVEEIDLLAGGATCLDCMRGLEHGPDGVDACQAREWTDEQRLVARHMAGLDAGASILVNTGAPSSGAHGADPGGQPTGPQPPDQGAPSNSGASRGT